jgi:hypothetical protein
MPRNRMHFISRRAPTGLLAVALMALAASAVANAQTNLQPQLVLRPVTTGDISTNKLPSTTETSPGLTNVGVGQAAYLEIDVTAGADLSTITNITWSLTTKPSGSIAIIGGSPLPAGMPVYAPADRSVYEVAARALLRPDLRGTYVVNATITLKDGTTTSVAQTVFAADYVGISACTVCHSGGLAADVVQSWSQTEHASVFKNNISGIGETTYPATCYPCHTVGYDLNSTIPNGGFDKVAKQVGWTPPTGTLSPANWDALPDQLKNVANIQCENCHGPGSMHAQTGTPFEISVPSNSGACSVCHDAPSHHIKSTEWYNSAHAVTTRDPSGAGRDACVGCHTNNGFIGRMTGATTVDTTYAPIMCQTCHEPHGETTPSTATHLIRNMDTLKLADGTQVAGAGEGALCMQCHQARVDAATYAPTTAGSAHFGPHEGPQADMIEGANGYTYGQDLPSSAHGDVVPDTCVTCHMQTVATTDPGFLHVGGHTFNASYTPAGSSTPEDLVGACQGCHGKEISSFNFRLFDYDGDGKIDGVQTEVQHLLDQLSAMLPPVGDPKTSLNIDNTWTQPQLEAAYNWLFVTNDGSKGIHNTAYTVGLLKASIADLKAHQQ